MENNMDNSITSADERYKELMAELKSSRENLTETQTKQLDLALELEYGQPYFKVKHFIGNAQVSAYAKYKQFLLELRSREEVIENFLMNIAKQEAQIEIIEEELKIETSPARVKLKEFELITNKNDLVKIHRRLKQAYEDRQNFLDALEDMYKTGEAYLPDGTDLADAVKDPKLSHELEAKHWQQRLGKQAALDIIAMGRIGTGNMEAISQMDEEDAVSALTIAMDWSTRVNKALSQIENNVVQEIEARKGFTLGLQERPDVKELE
jgi:hypothetical protein